MIGFVVEMCQSAYMIGFGVEMCVIVTVALMMPSSSSLLDTQSSSSILKQPGSSPE